MFWVVLVAYLACMIHRILETLHDLENKHPELRTDGLIMFISPRDYSRTKSLLDETHGWVSDELTWQGIEIRPEENVKEGDIRVGGK